MFSNEFAHVASEFPNLADIVRRLREKLLEIDSEGGSGPLRPDDFAAVLGADPNQIRSIFDQLYRRGVVTQDTMHECRECETVMTNEEYAAEDKECSSCGYRTPFEKSVIYRLVTPSAAATQSAKRTHKATPMNKQHKMAGMEFCRQSDEKPFLYECSVLGDITLQEVQSRLERKGLCVIRMAGQTPEEGILSSLAGHFGTLAEQQNDFRGTIKMIQPTDDGTRNSGDTRADIGLHVDGTQHDRHPPVLAFQFLDEPGYGGESIFVDGAAVLHDIEEQERVRIIEALAAVDAATFAKKDMSYTGAVFHATELETIACRIRFDEVMSPRSDLTGCVDELGTAYNNDAYRIRFKPREGDVVVFDNWRYLHARDRVFGHQIRRHRRIWINELFPYRADGMKLGLRGFGVGLVAKVQSANQGPR